MNDENKSLRELSLNALDKAIVLAPIIKLITTIEKIIFKKED